MGGVGGQGNLGGHIIGAGEGAGGAQVVFDVTRALAVGQVVTVKLVKDLAVRLAGNIGKHV